MRRLFQVYLSQYLRALEDDDGGNNNNDQDDDDEDYMLEDEEELFNSGYQQTSEDDEYTTDDEAYTTTTTRGQSPSSSSGLTRTGSDRQSRQQAQKLREEEKERLFQEQVRERLKALNEHNDLGQIIRAHTGRFCQQQSVSQFQQQNTPSCSSSMGSCNSNILAASSVVEDADIMIDDGQNENWRMCAGALHRHRSQMSQGQLASISSRFIPCSNKGPIGQFDSYLFCGQFSLDGNFFMSACQDQVIRIYDVNTILLKKSSISANTPQASSDDINSEHHEDSNSMDDSEEEYYARPTRSRYMMVHNQSVNKTPTVKHIREIHARDIGWSIIDCNPSPDNKFLVYSSWSSYIHLATFVPHDYDPNEDIDKRVKYIEKHERLFLNPGNIRFCAFSVRFSPTGKEILAGSNDDHLYIYDLDKNIRVERIHAHRSDINSVCYAGNSQPDIFFSGSDDGLCKVWDRRVCSSSSSSAVGVLVGHSDGITCVSSKGDGRYFISNGKDQTCKLWDIRKMADPNSNVPQIPKSNNLWDYRYEMAPTRHSRVIHPNDQSLMTYTGHQVLQTLIRCYFSPSQSTGQQYIYTGSHDGKIYVYDILTGAIVKQLEGHAHIVRDVHWHPFLPLMFSSSWDGSCLMWER
ncbi:hypothetical protein C9374_001425 [Naegleria lovaniensis]|uniref:Guanine nucleotide-binding protein subunit beta-like protein n=1 Tax=Naegleria lovaniensis TaxID=51637 RepID=A0AA88GXN7_NAELO|nr:uncharacterized protein C9374_001425 [Naegleria lovaniensis]KAG2387831.1 hypothetical protein C9374_001425 [Naegleria lovaniensis]